MNKVQIISDLNKKSLKIKNTILKHVKNLKIKKKNVIIVVGVRWFYASNFKKIKTIKNIFME